LSGTPTLLPATETGKFQTATFFGRADGTTTVQCYFSLEPTTDLTSVPMAVGGSLVIRPLANGLEGAPRLAVLGPFMLCEAYCFSGTCADNTLSVLLAK